MSLFPDISIAIRDKKKFSLRLSCIKEVCLFDIYLLVELSKRDKFIICLDKTFEKKPGIIYNIQHFDKIYNIFKSNAWI